MTTIRTFQPGDEAAQAEIYNEAAAGLPKFKPAAADEVARRTRAEDFDPGSRFFAVEDGRAVGYVVFNANGRVSYPWCRKGREHLAGPLFDAVLGAMRARGMRLAFAAYRGDWPGPAEFFRAHGFRLAREMVNFVIELADMPTMAEQPSAAVEPLQAADVPAVFALAPEALRARTPAELERHLLHNPYFDASAAFVLRGKPPARAILGAGVLVERPPYADPRQLDADMPCFRLGAFGAEGMQAKRVNGLFSFLTGTDRDVNALGLALMGHATFRLRSASATALAAQVPSDVPHLLRFYKQYFHRQGSFPVCERVLPGPGG